jgi:hypothetical protein
MKIVKLDKRHTGYGHFTHYISVDRTDAWVFWDWVNWSREQWGDSIPKSKYSKNPLTGRWTYLCTSRSYHSRRIYLSRESDLSWFILRWS